MSRHELLWPPDHFKVSSLVGHGTMATAANTPLVDYLVLCDMITLCLGGKCITATLIPTLYNSVTFVADAKSSVRIIASLLT